MRKVIPIQGDVANENIGLSSESQEKLIENVSVVFHVAATLKLDANLKDAINMNTEGTLRLLQLSTKMKRLKVNKINFLDQFYGFNLIYFTL